MACYAETGRSRPPNRLTLRVTLIRTSFPSASLFLWFSEEEVLFKHLCEDGGLKAAQPNAHMSPRISN
jgi:hypothetical protein